MCIKPIVHQRYLTPSVRVVEGRQVFTMALSDGPDMRSSQVRVIVVRVVVEKLGEGHQKTERHPKAILGFYSRRFGTV